jgi:hypothetical protein
MGPGKKVHKSLETGEFALLLSKEKIEYDIFIWCSGRNNNRFAPSSRRKIDWFIFVPDTASYIRG